MTKPERKQFIYEKLSAALRAIKNDPKFDWSRESEAICVAAETLVKAIQKFVDGKTTEDEIKPLYKVYVSLYAK